MTREEIKSRLAEVEDVRIIWGLFISPNLQGKTMGIVNQMAGLKKKKNKFYLYYPEKYTSTIKPLFKELCKTLNLCPLRRRLGMKVKLSYLEAITLLENLTPFLNKYTMSGYSETIPVFMADNEDEALDERRKELLPYRIAELGEEIYDIETAYKTLQGKKELLKKLRLEYHPIVEKDLLEEITKSNGEEKRNINTTE